MTEATSGISRLTPEVLDQYFESGVPTTHVLTERPRCELVVDPGAQTYELYTPVTGPEPEIVGMKRVVVDTVSMEDGQWFHLRLDCRDLRHEGYGVIVAVVQAMRGGASFAAATTAALGNLKALLASRRRLSNDQEIGLVGELLVIRDLLARHPETDVVDWWLGPLAEERDLAFPDHDIEVKTTLSERRSHVIHGTGQLQPNPGRPLWLLSIQLTRAGGADGVSLSELVGHVRSRLEQCGGRVLEYLVAVGWREDDADLYRTRYLLRSTPQAYLVGEDFPALTTDRLRASVPNHDLVSDVTYRVDVSGRDPGVPAGPLAEFLTPRGETRG